MLKSILKSCFVICLTVGLITVTSSLSGISPELKKIRAFIEKYEGKSVQSLQTQLSCIAVHASIEPKSFRHMIESFFMQGLSSFHISPFKEGDMKKLYARLNKRIDAKKLHVPHLAKAITATNFEKFLVFVKEYEDEEACKVSLEDGLKELCVSRKALVDFWAGQGVFLLAQEPFFTGNYSKIYNSLITQDFVIYNRIILYLCAQYHVFAALEMDIDCALAKKGSNLMTIENVRGLLSILRAVLYEAMCVTNREWNNVRDRLHPLTESVEGVLDSKIGQAVKDEIKRHCEKFLIPHLIASAATTLVIEEVYSLMDIQE